MNKKDLNELKRRFTKQKCSFTRLAGCYVNGEKHKLLTFTENFLNLPEDEFYKYLEIGKKALSGTIGNNILDLNFQVDENFQSEQQTMLLTLARSGLKDATLLQSFYDHIIENYIYPENYLILLFHDAYDIMKRTSDNIEVDESEEVYQYIICAICPVALSTEGLSYFEDEQKIKARMRDWLVDKPAHGFLYPGFVNRSSDVNTLFYFTKNPKDTHEELMIDGLGCGPRQTATIKKSTFQAIIEKAAGPDEDTSKKVYLSVQENLNDLIDEYKELYEAEEAEPIRLTTAKVRDLLADSGLDEEISEKVEVAYNQSFGDELLDAEHLLDGRLIKANAHKKVEAILLKQVAELENQLDVMKETVASTDPINADSLEKSDVDDLVLRVRPDKVAHIKTQIINDQRYLVIPIDDEDDHATINGIHTDL